MSSRPGLRLLPEGTLVATTSANDRTEDTGTSIGSVRFTMSGMEALADPWQGWALHDVPDHGFGVEIVCSHP